MRKRPIILMRVLLAIAALSAGTAATQAGQAYLTDLNANTISVIDTATDTVIAQPDIGSNSYFAAGVLPNGNFAYIGAFNPTRVVVLDTLTHAVVATVPVDSQPQGIAALPDSSRIYVSNYNSDSVSVIDTASHTVIATVPGIPRPYGIVASPDGAKVFVAGQGSSVAVIDTATNLVETTINVGAGAGAVTVDISPDGSTLYAIVFGPSEVAVIDTATLTVTNSFTFSGSFSRGVAVSADGARLYVAQRSSGQVMVLDAATGAEVVAIPVGTGPTGVAIDASGAKAYAVNSVDGSVSVIDTTSNTVVMTIPLTAEPNSTGRFITPDLAPLSVAVDTAHGGVKAGWTTGPQLICTASCQRNYALSSTVTLTAQPDAGYGFAGWAGDCSGDAVSTTVLMDQARSCTASFVALPPPPVPPTPPPPPPAWFNANALPGTLGTAIGNDGRFTSVSLAPFFADPQALTFGVTLADGGALPDGITFDPATLTFAGSTELPNRPVQPLSGAGPGTDAGWPNPVYPPSTTIGRLPITVTAGDRAGNSYALTVYLDLQGPRSPVAMAALSTTADGRAGGNGPSSRPALSHDGGQIVFQSAATNLVTTAQPTGIDVLRYHALSGRLDRLSQTAFPGGGPSAAALGPAIDPAVSRDGSHAAFTATGQGLVIGLDTRGVRQVYRIGLKHPRVDLDASTPVAELVSGTAAGLAGNGHSDSPALSADGRFVAFVSRASNLAPGLDDKPRIWRKDMATGQVALVAATASADPDITGDGRFVAFSSEGRIYLRDMGNDGLWPVGQGTRPRLSANGDVIVFTSAGAVIAVRNGAMTALGAGDQPVVSADGRFVAWRTPQGQIQAHDMLRGVSALVSRTAAGQPGNGMSGDPALSGDGRSIAFTTSARDLIAGNLAGGQVVLAGNPLIDPAGTRYWHVTSGDQQSLAIERQGDRAYVASLTYDAAGSATWAAGFCSFTDLTCAGRFAATPFTITFAANGTDATLTLNQTRLDLRAFPLGGNTPPAIPGLPEAGWWYDADDPSGRTGWFLATATPMADGIPAAPTALLAGLIYDGSGQPFWAAAAGTIANGGFTATLDRYAGGAPLGTMATQSPSASTLGPIALTWTGPRTATAIMPNGRRTNLARWPF